MYADGDFGMRFVGALETLLDPIVAMLDALPEHFDPDYAPRHILNLLSAWLGVDLDESRAISVQREVIRRAAELGQRRGTTGGLELALSLAFPDVPLRVEDDGGVIWESGATVESKPPQFVVYCDKPVTEDVQAAIARCIEQFKPVHTAYRLRVRAPKKKPAES
jgi:phage tail-like protein